MGRNGEFLAEDLQECLQEKHDMANELLTYVKDAERYRWLRDDLNIEWLADMLAIEEIATPADIDAAIDREMGGRNDG